MDIFIVVLISLACLIGTSAFGKYILGSPETFDGLIAIGKFTADEPVHGIGMIVGLLAISGLTIFILLALENFRRHLDAKWHGGSEE